MALFKKSYDAAIFNDQDASHDIYCVLNLSPHYIIAGQKIDFISDWVTGVVGRVYNPATLQSITTSFEDRERILKTETEHGLVPFDAKGLYVDALVYQRISKENNIKNEDLDTALKNTLRSAGSVISQDNKKALDMAIQNMQMPENISQRLFRSPFSKNSYN